MKKLFLIIFCAVLFFGLSSCTTYKLVVPVGLWQSDNPSITLDIENEERAHYGTYIKDSEEVVIYIVFGHVSNLLSVYDEIVNDDNYKGVWDDYEYFVGHWKVKDDKIYFALLPKWQEMHGIKEIVFTKIEDYE